MMKLKITALLACLAIIFFSCRKEQEFSHSEAGVWKVEKVEFKRTRDAESKWDTVILNPGIFYLYDFGGSTIYYNDCFYQADVHSITYKMLSHIGIDSSGGNFSWLFGPVADKTLSFAVLGGQDVEKDVNVNVDNSMYESQVWTYIETGDDGGHVTTYQEIFHVKRER
jgi:hypothetical protein